MNIKYETRTVNVPYLAKQDFTVKEKSRHCSAYYVFARPLTCPVAPIFLDKNMTTFYLEWWMKHASAQARSQVFHDVNRWTRRAWMRAASKVRAHVRWNRSNEFCFLPSYWIVNEMSARGANNWENYAELDDGSWVYVQPSSVRPGRSMTDILESARGRDYMDQDFKLWVRFTYLADRLSYKTAPYVLGRHIIKMYQEDGKHLLGV